MKYDFDKVLDRTGTNSVKWDYLEEIYGRKDIIPMWVADMDFPSPQPVVDALIKRAGHGIYGYTEVPESGYEAIIDWVYKRHGWQIKKEWIVFTPGVVPGLCMSVMAYTSPGDKAAIQSPVYPPFYSAARTSGRILVDSHLKMENGKYTMDYDDLENKFKSGVKMLILCSPHNPVGRVWTREELLRLQELCSRYGVIIVSDEIHSDIIFKGHRHIPMAGLTEEAGKNTVTFIAPSKTFNIAGLSMSLGIIPDNALREKFKSVIESLRLEPGNLFGIYAMEAAYSHGEEWLQQLLEYVEGNMDYLCDYVDKHIPGIKVRKPEGTYLAWLDCRGLGMDQKELVEFMVQKAGVGLNDGAIFGTGGQGFMRMNLGCPRPLLQEGLKRIEEAVKSIGRGK